MSEESDFANDLLEGAEAIAHFLYGDKQHRRKVYHLVASSRFPVFKLGSTICARRSVVLKWIADQEGRNANDNYKPVLNSVKTGNL